LTCVAPWKNLLSCREASSRLPFFRDEAEKMPTGGKESQGFRNVKDGKTYADEKPRQLDRIDDHAPDKLAYSY
jgi:hypothetical protein